MTEKMVVGSSGICVYEKIDYYRERKPDIRVDKIVDIVH